MLRISIFLLVALAASGALASSPIVDFQEQFSELSHGIEFELQEYRAKNSHVRSEVIHRSLDGLGNLTIEMREITADYWAQIEAHEYATPECLELLRPEFDYYVWYASLDIQNMAGYLDRLTREDAWYRFNPVIAYAQRENSRAIYQTVQTLGRNQFLDNMADTVTELQDELAYYQNAWEGFQEWLDQELDNVSVLWYRVEDEIAWWHEFTVRWHHVFMGYQLNRPGYECYPEEIRVKSDRSILGEAFKGKLKELGDRKALKGN
ncbi:hypothetical protein RP20_CCG002079 [Aedes albopictus]|nr:hypothetical protein RP20_CCG002079 [Aedes albopictus]